MLPVPILETCSFTSFSASVSTLNQQIFTYFEQRGSFLSSCYHLNLKQAFKVKNLVPTTMHYSCCHLLRALYQVLVRMLMQQRSLLSVNSLFFHRPSGRAEWGKQVHYDLSENGEYNDFTHLTSGLMLLALTFILQTLLRKRKNWT